MNDWSTDREYQEDGRPIYTEDEYRRIIFPIEQALPILPKHMRASVARLRPDLAEEIRAIELLGA